MKSIPVTESLINLVRGHKCLWDKTNSGFKDTLLKRHCYEQIFQGLLAEFDQKTLEDCDFFSYHDVKKKLKSLKNTYQQQKKKTRIESKSGSGAAPCKPWVWFESLSFLDNNCDYPELQSLQTSSKLPGEQEEVNHY